MALVGFTALLGALAAFGASPAHADPDGGFKVTSPGSGIVSDCRQVDPDNVNCTFEEALDRANQDSNHSTINFALDG